MNNGNTYPFYSFVLSIHLLYEFLLSIDICGDLVNKLFFGEID